MQAIDDKPLRPGKTEPAHAAVERGSHQPRDIGDQKADVAFVF
jgi:hypothetical protein